MEGNNCTSSYKIHEIITFTVRQLVCFDCWQLTQNGLTFPQLSNLVKKKKYDFLRMKLTEKLNDFLISHVGVRDGEWPEESGQTLNVTWLLQTLADGCDLRHGERKGSGCSEHGMVWQEGVRGWTTICGSRGGRMTLLTRTWRNRGPWVIQERVSWPKSESHS